MIFADIDDAAAGFICVALNDLTRRMAYNGHKPPAGVGEFAAWCQQRARQGQAGSTVAVLDGLEQAAAVGRGVLDYDDAAGYLGVSRSSVRRLVERGELPTVSIAGAVRIRLADLTAYLDALPVIVRRKAA